MDVVVAGAHGLIGSALVADLVAGGHGVIRLVRRGAERPGELTGRPGPRRPADGSASNPTAGPASDRTPEHVARRTPDVATPGTYPDAPRGTVADVPWDPRTGELDLARVEGAGAVVNLAGAGIGDRRWTRSYKQTLLGSRTTTTSLLARTVARLDARPVLVNGSAVGAYGDRGDEILTEASGRGDGFLAGLVESWENATTPASEAGARVVWLRSGVVLSPSGGALSTLLPLLRRGLGGPLGTGRQWWSWISLVDEVAAIRHVLETDVHGTVNAVAPEPTTHRAVIQALAGALHRPAALAVPRIALRVAVGEFADDLVASQRVVPGVLKRTGFRWAHPDPQHAADWVLDPG